MKVEILGAGCAKCQALAASANQAVADLAVADQVEVVKVDDMREIVTRGVMVTPALAIDGEVVSSGRQLAPAEIQTLITTALAGRD
jgi:small redox-active disulfide protein 2